MNGGMNHRSAVAFAIAVGMGLLPFGSIPVCAQPVSVTVHLDRNEIAVGGSTTLRVVAQIVEDQRADTDRIFSWYVDLLNDNAAAAAGRYADLARPASDKDPRTSSAGVTDGAHRVGIFDTFLDLTDAGRLEPVELFTVPVVGVQAGEATFRVRAGTGVNNLSADFIVAPSGGGDPLIGGDYSAAAATLVVRADGGDEVVANLVTAPLPGGQGVRSTITFNLLAGRNHVVEFRDSLVAGAGWQALPGAPHNSGTVVDDSTAGTRFYRVKAE